ncbi:Hsp33 family molecular chaperone HslO [Rubellimicrobium sp. CFH 75288]|uniref:Hsp33 family molecular chaperone HslO n=1 Tax=Rubellimicrobium sp. CFH 75288 TaxID=2697034 RepID=UPI0014135A55|nr:Hsp33 family molecular chaperone HslO [Rubellimicrobium sp. CFH 75288]NAZ37757.1 Hsp33 family molecular chaperone HslO [Rubellimicrobium sp. CFH 75288]
MSLGARLAWDDTVLPFTLDASDIRGRVARLDGALERILAQHDYPSAIEPLVAETALLAALIGPTVKLRWKLSVQVRGDGPARIVAADYYAPAEPGQPARLRAWASFDPARLDPEGPSFSQLGSGYFALLIDQGEGMLPTQGITPLAGGSLAACAETYFAQSEQIPTRFALGMGRDAEDRWRAGGVMLQHMPRPGGSVAAAQGSGEGGLLGPADILDGAEGENWSRATILLDTARPEELVGPAVGSTDLLVRLFHEERPRVHEAQPLAFGCSCSEERVRRSLSIYSRKDIAHMTTDDGVVTADCQFCGAHYEFDPRTLGFEAEGRAGRDAGAAL